MAEAEEVLLDAAELVASRLRALWTRQRSDDEPAAAAGRRRLACWLAACFGRSFALEAIDAPPAPGWLARALGRAAPWQRRPVAVATASDACLWLPRDSLVRLGSSRERSALLPALGLGMRAAWGWGRAQALARGPEGDAVWALEGALVDEALARALPGLAVEIAAARCSALVARPSFAALRPGERELEQLVRSLLRTPVSEVPPLVARLVAGAVGAASLRDFARRLAESFQAEARRSYRGVAPVVHWGAPDLGVDLERIPAGNEAVRGSRLPVPSRSLRRRIARRPPDPTAGEGHRGPFLLPQSDPKLSVQDARGLDRPPDRGDEDPDALAEEIARLPELPIVESPHAVREILEEAGRRPGPASARTARIDAVDAAFVYPEWDHRSRRYTARGCILRESRAPASDRHWPVRMQRERTVLLRRLRRHFEALRPRWTRVPRRLDGDGLDLDGWVEEFAERRAGLAPAGRLYTQERPGRRDVAVALLVDASGSTDAWISKTQRVIDVAKLAALCFCEALAALGDRHALYAFSGCGSEDVRVWVGKRFDEPWGELVRERLGALEPERFTRLGAPIRHVAASLARTGARLRLLLLLSDGKPNDEDAYAGEYGIEDARQALVEARALGVRPFCITIDREGPGYLPRLFGPHGYTVLWDVEQLPLGLLRVYRRLATPRGAIR